MSIKPLIVAVAALFSAAPAYAAVYDVQVDPNITVTPTPVLAGQTVRIYSSIVNAGTEDMEGVAFISDDGGQIAVKPYSAKSGGKAEEVWTLWTPVSQGTHTIRVDAVNEGNIPDATPTDNTRTVSVFVDLDTDGDGIGNAADPDDDGDGVPDGDDQFPLDPSKSKDTDGDGQDNAADSDDDNDGLYDFEEEKLGTDPLKRDTDGDGAGDKEDAYPLDPNKSQNDPPPPAPPSPSDESPPSSPAEDPSQPQSLSAPTQESSGVQIAQAASNLEAAVTTSIGLNGSSATSSDATEDGVTATSAWVTLLAGEEAKEDETSKSKGWKDAVLPWFGKDGNKFVKSLWALAGTSLLLAGTFYFIGKKKK